MTTYSIIMPAYNSSSTVSRAIESVLKQTYSSWELIVVDDGSTDETKSIVFSFAENDKRIKYLFQPNQGPGSARNMGIKKSTGKYICFLDSDDYWEMDFLETAETCSSEGNADVIFYDLLREKDDGRKIGISKSSRFSACSKEELLSYQIAGFLEWGMTKIVKSSVIKNNGLAFDDNAVAEEAIFSFDVIFYSKSFAFADKILYHYVNNENGQHREGSCDPWYSMTIEMKEHLKKASIESFYSKPLTTLAMRSFLISAYRTFLKSSYRSAKQAILETEKKYKDDFTLYQYDESLMDNKTRLLAWFLKHRFFFLLYCLSRIRGKKK